jgi:hypothetical protein
VQGVLEVPALILQRLLVMTGYIKALEETMAAAVAAHMAAAAVHSELFGPVTQDNSHLQTQETYNGLLYKNSRGYSI